MPQPYRGRGKRFGVSSSKQVRVRTGIKRGASGWTKRASAAVDPSFPRNVARRPRLDYTPGQLTARKKRRPLPRNQGWWESNRGRRHA